LLVKLKFMPNQYENVGNSVSHLGQVASQIALGLAQQRNQQAQAQQMMQLKLREQAMQEAIARQRGELMGQQGRQAESVTGFNTARAGQVTNTERSKGQLKDALWNAGMVQAGQNQGVDMGPRNDIAIARVMEAMGGVPSSGFNPDSMAKMMQMGDPRAQQMMATGTKMNATVGPGAMLYDVMNQQPLVSSPRTVSQGQALVPNVAGSVGPERTFAPQNYQQLLGSLANIRGQGMAFGEQTNPDDPMNAQVTQAIQALIPQLLNQATNAPKGGQIQAPAPSGNTRVGLQGGPTQFASPQSQAEFDALPSGSYYINPADQKQYRKN